MLNIISSINSIERNLNELSNKENGINGEIDEPVYQGNYEDCWAISGVLAMSYTDTGAEIIRESINVKNDGSINIAFSGLNSEYTITKDEFEANNYPILDPKADLSTGDDDMLAIEMGINKSIQEKGITKYSVENGGNPYYVFKLFKAEEITVTKSQQDIEEAFDKFEDNPKQYAMTIGTIGSSVCGLRQDHGYTIKNISDDNVTLIDPWDTTQEITVSRSELLENYKNLSIVYADF